MKPLTSYNTEVENKKNERIKMIRSDRGGEYFSNECNASCEEHEIIHQKSKSQPLLFLNKMIWLK